MTKVKFAELKNGDQFVLNDVTYAKTTPQKVSCCKTLNATRLDNNEKVMIKPIEFVEKVEPQSDN